MEFVSALWHLDEDQVKAVLGRHVVSLHGRCRAIKLAFAKRVHAAGKKLLWIFFRLPPLVRSRCRLFRSAISRALSTIQKWTASGLLFVISNFNFYRT